MIPTERMQERVARSRDDSDIALLHDLFYLGEWLIKLTTAGLLGGVGDDKDSSRYRLEHALVRANSIGEWDSALDDILIGAASQHLTKEARRERTELTQRFSRTDDTWQVKMAVLLRTACLDIDPAYNELPGKMAARNWFQDLVWLRNAIRGHGAPSADTSARLIGPLQQSLQLLIDNFSLFQRSWAYLRRNLSGKYRVIPVGGSCAEFQFLKTDSSQNLGDGVYIYLGEFRPVGLLFTDVDLADFLLPNGNLKDRSFELLSYVTGDRRAGDASPYMRPPRELPESETHGLGALEPHGNCFASIPPRVEGYIARPQLEEELRQRLSNDRHPVVTLVGRGGIGKTSLAIEVLHSLTTQERFFTLVWFSSRDIDLLPEGPKHVKPAVLTVEDIAEQYVDQLSPREADQPKFNAVDYFAKVLTSNDVGATLFVFDNFETVRNPLDLYNWLDTYIRLPNKILITTRGRDFRGDYHVEVRGMNEPEFEQLVGRTADRLGIISLLDKDYVRHLYEESGGHPYVVKVMLGVAADARKPVRVQRVMAAREDILEALFERTFGQLSPVARRIFLTLSSWNSTIPRVALEAALLRPANEAMDVEDGIAALQRSSLIEMVSSSQDEQEFISVPLAARLFGKRKLLVSPIKSTIDADTEFIRLVGAMDPSEIERGVGPRVNGLFRNVADAVQGSGKAIDQFLPILEYVATVYAPAWLKLADFYLGEMAEEGLDRALEAVRRYLESVPTDWEAWRRLAMLSRQKGDYLGEINALVQRANQPSVPYEDISYAATRLNGMLSEGKLKMDPMERRLLLEQVFELMVERLDEADATDCSRVAWVLRNLGREAEVRQYAEIGLSRDPDNVHCLKLVGVLPGER